MSPATPFVLFLLAGWLPGQTAKPPTRLDITAAPYNAVGDGVTDNTAAINRALADAAKTNPHQEVTAPKGTFAHAGVLRVNGVTLSGKGPQTIFLATNPVEGAIVLTGARGAVHNCALTSPNSQKRLSNSHSAAIAVDGATDFRISSVFIGAQGETGKPGVTGAASAGVLCADASSSRGMITHCTIYGTLADGIHLTAGASQIMVRKNTLVQIGDDMIAVVSYLKDKAVVKTITIEDNHCVSQTHGRGISVVGGEDVTISRNIIESSDAAGIYLAAENSYNTYGPSNIRVLENTIRNANQNHATTHGGIFVFGRQTMENGQSVRYPASDIRISGNTLTNTFYMGIRVGGQADRILVNDNHINGTTAEGIAISDTGDKTPGAGAQNVAVSGNVVENTRSGAIKVFPSMQNALLLKKNRLRDIGTSKNPVDVISIDSGAMGIRGLQITGNSYENPGNYPTRNFINCGISARAAGTTAEAITKNNTAKTITAKPIVVTP